MKLTYVLVIISCCCLQFSKGQSMPKCPPEGVAYQPLHECNKYLFCLNGIESEMTCPSALYFNPNTKHCDFPENVIDCGGGTRPPIMSPSIPTDAPTTLIPPPRETLTECGQTTVANRGKIQYKLDQQYDAGELCIFIVRFKRGYVRCNVKLEADGFSEIDKNAIKVLSYKNHGLGSTYYELGPQNRTTKTDGYGMVILFKTISNAGTGFKLSFKISYEFSTEAYLGKDMTLSNEAASSLISPFSTMSQARHNFFFFTSGSKLINQTGSYLKLRLAIAGDLGNIINKCSNNFSVYYFEDDLKEERVYCEDFLSDEVYEFTTLGLLIVYQGQYRNNPSSNGTMMIAWEKV